MEITDEQFVSQIMRHLFRTRGLDLSGYTQGFVFRSIKKRLGRTGIDDYGRYLRMLAESDEETSQLLASLSINVTEFFRDRSAWESFSAHVVRPLIESKTDGGGILRIWSAGCATGQETYTIAMCVHEEAKKLKNAMPFLTAVVGTDISVSALDKAKDGIYTHNEVRGIPDRLLKEYFVPRHGNFEVSERLHKGVRFARENLLDKPGSKYFDAIVCRNVMIYFSREMHDTVTMNLYEALRKGGFLMLGQTETLMGAPRSSFEVIDLENRILQKKT